MVKNRAARQYMKEVKAMVPGCCRQRRLILNQIKNQVNDYLSENEHAGMDDLYSRFGSSEQIASSFVGHMEEQELIAGLKGSTLLKKAVIVVAAVIVLLWIGVVSLTYVDHRKDINGFYIEEIEVVEDISSQKGAK